MEFYSQYWDYVRTERTLVIGHREEGRIEGRIEGEAKGRLETRIEIAKGLLKHPGFTKEGIAAVTQLSLDEITFLAQSEVAPIS